MAKRFPLEMADGSVARTLEDIREHFDEETLLGYYEDGMLLRWLEDRFYDEEVEGVKFEDLPEDWVCPLCGVGKDMFEKMED